MFVSFFPNPRPFFWSVLLWAAVCMSTWYMGGAELGDTLGFAAASEDGRPPIGVSRFWSGPFLWFYIYYAVCAGLFAAFWQLRAPHPWWRWSVLGSALDPRTSLGWFSPVVLNDVEDRHFPSYYYSYGEQLQHAAAP